MLLAGYIALGAIAGLIAGIFGLGGGIIIVPALIFTFGYLNFPPEVLTHLAVGTSLATILFTSLSAIYVHYRKLSIDWLLAVKLSAGMLPGGGSGAALAEFMPGAILQRIFALYCLFVAIQMWFAWSPKAALTLPTRFGCALLGGLIGIMSGIFGIAGGSLVVPVLTLYRVKITRAIATSAVTAFPIALSGTVGYLIAGWNNAVLPEGCVGYIYWPAMLGIILSSTVFAKIGALLAHNLPPGNVKKLLALLLLVAVKLFI